MRFDPINASTFTNHLNSLFVHRPPTPGTTVRALPTSFLTSRTGLGGPSRSPPLTWDFRSTSLGGACTATRTVTVVVACRRRCPHPNRHGNSGGSKCNGSNSSSARRQEGRETERKRGKEMAQQQPAREQRLESSLMRTDPTIARKMICGSNKRRRRRRRPRHQHQHQHQQQHQQGILRTPRFLASTGTALTVEA